MAQKTEELDLVEQAIQGDAEAFGALYELCLGDIYRYVYYRVGNSQDAEDLTEEVFLKAWQYIPSYRPTGAPFRTWLFRIAYTTVVDHYRASGADIPLAHLAFLFNNHDDSPEEEVVAKERSELLRRSLARLTPTEQDLLILRFINGLRVDEVAEVLEQSSGSVRVLQHRALKTLHALLEIERVTQSGQRYG